MNTRTHISTLKQLMRGPEFESKLGGVCGSLEGGKEKMELCNYAIISNIKEIIKKGLENCWLS